MLLGAKEKSLKMGRGYEAYVRVKSALGFEISVSRAAICDLGILSAHIENFSDATYRG